MANLNSTANWVAEVIQETTASLLEIPVLSPGGGTARERNASTDPISEFYTSHPYPPPVENLDRARDQWNDDRRRAEYHLFWPDRPYRADLDILVAGCGTWQAAKHALCHPEANVVGIDVSTTSLEHTEKLKKKYNLTNLMTEQVPIESVSALRQNFDLIICTGVLHHLADPDEGLAALRSVLKPGGVLYFMVYAPYGRAGIYLLQDYCRKLGVGTSAKEIDDLARVVEALPPHHPLVTLLNGSRDALNADALADALLNPRDRSYSIPQLFDFIERNGLAFGRWYRQAPYLSQCGSIAATPHARHILEMTEPEQYAALELLRGTITCHSVIAYRSEADGDRVELSFDDERWPTYIPLRLPSTMCVEERLPAGAAGVLLNRSHQFHDLVLIINEREKRMFEAIDGRRSISDIVDQSGAVASEARIFFEKLWWYDQVVFDRSSKGGLSP